MRTAAACFVLAAAIATPGIVLAATSNGTSHVYNIVAGQTFTVSGTFHPIEPQPVDPRLRPAVAVVRDALKARGQTNLRTFADAPGIASIVQMPNPGQHCATLVLFQVTRQLKGAFNGAPCGHGSLLRGNVEVDYTPKSLGPTIEQALATLR